MAEYRKQFLALDLETTHLDIQEGRIMEVGAVETEIVFDSKTQKVKAVFGKSLETLVNPEIPVSQSALLLTAISPDELQKAPTWRGVKAQIKKFLAGKQLLGHNVGFDLDFLKNQGLNLGDSYFDTLEITQTFLPTSPSHSLEFLSQELEVGSRSSHRALADAQSAALVLAQTLNVFLGYEASLKKEILRFLESSHLAFRDLFLDLPSVKKQAPARSRGYSSSKETLGSKESRFAGMFAQWPDRTLLSLPLSFSGGEQLLSDLSHLKKSGLVGVAHPAYLDTLPEDQKLASPFWALCEKRWNRLKAQEQLPDIGCKILIKTAIFRSGSRSFDLSQLKWNPDERLLLSAITGDPAVCPHHRCGYFGLLSLLAPNWVYFSDLRGFFELVNHWPIKVEGFSLLLFDLSRIEEELTESLTESWNLRKVRSKLTLLYPLEAENLSWHTQVPSEIQQIADELDLFFGILHLVYLKNERQFAEHVMLDEAERNSYRFSRLVPPAEKLLTKLDKVKIFLRNQGKLAAAEERAEFGALVNEFQNLAIFLRELFLEPVPHKIYWLKFNSQWVDLNSAPATLSDKWRAVCANFQSTTLIDTAVSPIAWQYFQRRLGLQEITITAVPSQEQQPTTYVKIFPKIASNADLLTLASSLSGRSLFIVPNEKQLVEFYELLKTKSGQSEILAYRYSGNPALLKRKYRESKEVILLVTTNIFLRHFQSLASTENLVLVRLPFEAPGTRAAVLKGDWQEVFVDHVLPRAVHLLHIIFSRFLAARPRSPQQIYLLDPRVLSEYDRQFMNYLEELPNFKISTIDKP